MAPTTILNRKLDYIFPVVLWCLGATLIIIALTLKSKVGNLDDFQGGWLKPVVGES